MDLRFYWYYPALMDLYGSWANVAVLRRLLERLGHTVTVTGIAPGEDVSLGLPDEPDLVYMGAGTERRQKAAMEDFRRYGETVKAAAGAGCTMLFCGTAMELLGETVTDRDGETWAGIGLGSFTTVQGPRRIVGDVLGKTELSDAPVVGFMNKCSVISGVGKPLLTSLRMGFGNEAERGPEGFHRGNVFASELTGPLLVKDPPILEAVAAAILSRRGQPLPDPWPVDRWAKEGHAVTVRELEARCR